MFNRNVCICSFAYYTCICRQTEYTSWLVFSVWGKVVVKADVITALISTVIVHDEKNNFKTIYISVNFL